MQPHGGQARGRVRTARLPACGDPPRASLFSEGKTCLHLSRFPRQLGPDTLQTVLCLLVRPHVPPTAKRGPWGE